MAYTPNNSATLQDVQDGSPKVYNYLRPNGFRFSLKDLPNTSYTVQSAVLPGLQLGFAMQQTPLVDIPRIGDKNTFGDFTMKFLIAEDMSNYLELYEWVIALGFPNDRSQYASFVGDRLNRFPFFKNSFGDTEALGYSDGTLTILDSNNVPKTNIIMKDMFPVSIDALEFDVTTNTVDYFVGVASFKYTTFTIEAL